MLFFWTFGKIKPCFIARTELIDTIATTISLKFIVIKGLFHKKIEVLLKQTAYIFARLIRFDTTMPNELHVRQGHTESLLECEPFLCTNINTKFSSA